MSSVGDDKCVNYKSKICGIVFSKIMVNNQQTIFSMFLMFKFKIFRMSNLFPWVRLGVIQLFAFYEIYRQFSVKPG